MITYRLVQNDQESDPAWSLYERATGEDWSMVAVEFGPMTAADAQQWADQRLGAFLELDWKSDDGTVFSRAWTATEAEITDDE